MNRLAQETSPYLQQHADNPVDWWPWCEEALTAAREQDKPVLLSIGYSACHWCHVMAHESFEDAEVADVMNRLFINIKVDREERPDVDQIYQTAHQMLAQRGGGWPLTMFLAPDGAPFFGGTYFPKEQRYGLPGFVGLLERVATAYVEQRESILDQNLGVVKALGRTLPEGYIRPATFEVTPIAAARDLLLASFDPRHGGFGSAPKFPHPTDLALLMRQAVLAGDKEALHAMLMTLRCMAEGGIYDQLGGGFSRYSVDVAWNIPHFEKMLYDNGPLLAMNAEAWALTQDSLFKHVVADTAAWVMREMQSPEGGYYASLDADSEGEEGKYYVWSRDEIPPVIGPAEYKLFAAHYGLDRDANFEETHWHLYVARPLAEVAVEFGLPEADLRMRLDLARSMLFARRETRVRPGRDDKILSSWNALMITGMARAAAVFGEADWLRSAQRAMDFIQDTLWQDGRLLATFKDDKAHLNAYLDDHAYLIEAALALMQVAFREKDLRFAMQLADALLEEFEDVDAGGFFFTRHDHERLILRPKPGHDNAMPAGNAVTAFALQRLGHLLGEHKYIEAAERCLALFYASFSSNPGGYSSMLLALAEQLTPPTIIILRGDSDVAAEWLRKLHARCMPDTLSLYLPDRAALPAAMNKPHDSTSGPASAWVCRGTNCLPPVTSFDALCTLLSDSENNHNEDSRHV